LPHSQRTHWYNSVPAHEASLWADEQGKGEESRRAVYHAYFVGTLNIASSDVLTGLAEDLGLASNDLRGTLAEGRYRPAVDEQFNRVRSLGITGVPAYVAGSGVGLRCSASRGAGIRPQGRDQDRAASAVQADANGEGIFSAGVAKLLASFFSSPHPLIPRTAFPELTEREREVLDLIAQGATNLSIARRLTLSGKTVSNYVSNTLSKLQVVDRSEAVVQAREAGMRIRTDRERHISY
jgi:DNA-binding CsgD family transcriptional regulator